VDLVGVYGSARDQYIMLALSARASAGGSVEVSDEKILEVGSQLVPGRALVRCTLVVGRVAGGLLFAVPSTFFVFDWCCPFHPPVLSARVLPPVLFLVGMRILGLSPL